MSDKRRREILLQMESFEQQQREKGVTISPTWNAIKQNLGYNRAWLSMARYLIDTNVFIKMCGDFALLGEDVWAIVSNYENQLCISSESLKELVHLYNTKPYVRRLWKSKRDMLLSITDVFHVNVLYVTKDVIDRYAEMYINEYEQHNDPSDHVIIATALVYGIPLISNDKKFAYYRNQGLDLIEY